MTRRSLALVASSGVLISAAAMIPAAQTAKSAGQPQLYQAIIVTVQPGMMSEYTEYQQKDVMPALKKGGAPGRIAWSSGAFGDAYTFAFFSPVANLSQYDEPNPVAKALGEQAAGELMARGAKMTTSRRVMLVRTRPDLSIINSDPSGPRAPLAIVTHVTVADGRRAEFEAVLKREVLPVLQQAKVKRYDVLEAIYGAPAGTYHTALAFDSYEAIGKGHPLVQALGDEGMKKLEAKFAGITTSVERFVARYRADLSFAQSSPSTR